MSPAQKGQVVEALDEVPLDWLDRDEKRPPVDIFEELQEAMSPAWRACIWYIQSILVQWLTVRPIGPKSNMVKLRHGESACVIHVKRYEVKAEMCENYTVESLVAECYPALVATKTTIKKANQAACDGWQVPETHLPVLSRVITVTGIVIVQKALRLNPHPKEVIAMERKKAYYIDREVITRHIGNISAYFAVTNNTWGKNRLDVLAQPDKASLPPYLRGSRSRRQSDPSTAYGSQRYYRSDVISSAWHVTLIYEDFQ
ncbi:uncharacterized protein BDW43DRAFT_316039 [Aspergillus alliaceus]|uniref:uncharacterized protein n=1 Tax=Petromyces alliaceus TaxID=209559 RepID=UPI0012A6E856|nr:uncharacterized protein BDW43DRAFT_316039 [Aspergillus alliaceus]KAB8228294.1 hypothetical protein BDW43DRAFT_316039 [Aspergillus alliaceus]